MRFDSGVYIFIDGMGDGTEGYRVWSPHNLLRRFSVVEEKPDTDFSKTKSLLEKYLDDHYPAGAPHTVTFNPSQPLLMAAHGTAGVIIDVTTKPKLH